MKYKILIIFSVIFALIALSGTASLSTMPNAFPNASTPSFSASISVPHYVYKNESFQLNVTESGGYHNYSVAVYLGAVNDTGLSPLSHYVASTTNGNFSIAVKAPSECESVYGYVDAYAMNSTGHKVSYTDKITPINVSNPIVFNSTVKNTGPGPIHNIMLTYTVAHGKSSEVVGLSHISTIKANSTYKSNITVPAALVYKGKDTLTVTTNNPVIKISGKSAVTFYNGNQPNYNWIYYIAAVAIAISVFLILASGKRNVVKVPKWKRSKSSKRTQKAQKSK
jgi:hypothetical protein